MALTKSAADSLAERLAKQEASRLGKADAWEECAAMKLPEAQQAALLRALTAPR